VACAFYPSRVSLLRIERFRSAFQLRTGCLRMLPQEILQFPSADYCGPDESFYAGFSRVWRDGVLAQKGAHHLSAGRPGAVRFRSPGSSVDSLSSPSSVL